MLLAVEVNDSVVDDVPIKDETLFKSIKLVDSVCDVGAVISW